MATIEPSPYWITVEYVGEGERERDDSPVHDLDLVLFVSVAPIVVGG